MTNTNRDDEIAASWTTNAGAWTRAVRASLIPSRAAGTDHAILSAVRRHRPGSVLDVGCGEGWLTRALDAEGYAVCGIDGSEPLIAFARELGGPGYLFLPYDSIIAEPRHAGGPYDAIVLNFSLFAERVAPLLEALATRLVEGGVMIIQTLHPWSSTEDAGYIDGWRVATFAGFGGPFPMAMPWFYRTLASWSREVADAGLAIERIEEPLDPETNEPLSLVLTLRPAFPGSDRALE